MTTSNRFE